jgi:hypothetical protein
MPEQNLILRPTVIGGSKLANDYSVYFEDRPVGRIREASERIGFNPGWTWAVNPSLPIPTWAHGSEDSLEAAKEAFRAAWERFYAGLKPSDIEYWHDIVDAADKRFGR